MNDYHIHVAGDGEFAFSEGRITGYIEKAQSLGLQEIGFSEHHEVLDGLDWGLLDSASADQGLIVRRALEIGFEPGMEDAIDRMIRSCDYDYIIGSLHFIDGWAFDHPDFKNEYGSRDVDEVYARYMELMMQLVASGRFDYIGHLDVVKKWGDRPRNIRRYREMMENLLKQVSLAGMAVEINSAGLRKPVGELYPAPDIIEMMYNKNVPICFGSDAHRPEEVGMGLDVALKAARAAGYRKMLSYEKRRRSIIDI